MARDRSRDIGRESGRREFLLKAGAGVAVGLAGVVGLLSTGSFSVGDLTRGSTVGVAADTDGILGLSVTGTVKKNNQEALVDIENNASETVSVTVSLDDCSQGTLYDSDESGCSVTLSIDPGIIKTVDIQADVTGTIPFTVSGTTPDFSFTANRETNAESGSTGPSADAGGPYSLGEDTSTELDGTGSSGNSLTYSWQITDGGGTLDDASTATPVYNAPTVQSDTTVTVELTVTDNKNNSDTDTATISVTDTGDPPTVDSLTVTKTGSQNRKFDISADVSDPDNDLDRVEIVVVNTQNGNTAYSNTLTVSGGSDSISDTTDKLGNKKEYRIDVTVYDTKDKKDTQSVTKTTG